MGKKYQRILVADRHQNMLEGIRGLLETLFQSVVMVADAGSLFDAVTKLNPDLVVVDLSLSVAGGVHIVSDLKGRFPNLKVVAMSVHDEKVAVTDVMETGAEGFVLKRSVATDLIPAVRAVVSGRTYVSPAIRRLYLKDRWGRDNGFVGTVKKV